MWEGQNVINTTQYNVVQYNNTFWHYILSLLCLNEAVKSSQFTKFTVQLFGWCTKVVSGISIGISICINNSNNVYMLKNVVTLSFSSSAQFTSVFIVLPEVWLSARFRLDIEKGIEYHFLRLKWYGDITKVCHYSMYCTTCEIMEEEASSVGSHMIFGDGCQYV